MAIGTDRIRVFQGEDARLDFTHTGDISGWNIQISVGDPPDDPLISKAGVIDDGANGLYHFSLNQSETEVAAGTYKYDVWRTDTNLEGVIARGVFVITDAVRQTA